MGFGQSMATSNRGAWAAAGFCAAAAFGAAGALGAPCGAAEPAASALSAAHATACIRSVGLRFIASLLSVRHRTPLAATCSDRHGGGVYFRSNATIPFYAVSPPSVRGGVRVAALAGALLLAAPALPSAHEIPARVTII